MEGVMGETKSRNRAERRHPEHRSLAGPQDLADHVGVPLATVYRWNSHGGGPRFIHVGRHVRYRWSDIDAWLEQNAAS